MLGVVLLGGVADCHRAPPAPPERMPVPGSEAMRRHAPDSSAPNGPRVDCAGCRPGALPLFVVDGVIVAHRLPDHLERALIDTVIIRRGLDAAAGYGELGRDGVVEIRMLRRDQHPAFTLPDSTPLSLPQAATVCGATGRGTPLVVIDGFALPGNAAVESKWPELRWDEVLRRDRYTPEEAMADCGKAGRWGAELYTTTYAGSADSSIRRRPPVRFHILGGSSELSPADSGALIVINGVVISAGDSALRRLAPTDIERIEALRCFDAVARYGRRARNGAIIITLKPGAPAQRPAREP